MTGVLSQEEINEFLVAINTAQTEPDDIRPDARYPTRMLKILDFKRPGILSRRLYRDLSVIHEDLPISWGAIFSQYCREEVHISVSDICHLTLNEFVRSCPTPTSLIVSQGIVNSVPIKMPFIIEISPVISHIILYRLFQGKTDGYYDYLEKEPNSLPLSFLEKTALQYFSNLLLKKYSKNWSRKFGSKTEFHFKSLGNNPQYVDIAASKEMVVGIFLSVKIKNSEGLINICLPNHFLRQVFPYLPQVKVYKDSKEDKKKNSLPIPKHIKDKMLLMLNAEYFRQIMSLKDLLHIKVGNVLYAPYSPRKK